MQKMISEELKLRATMQPIHLLLQIQVILLKVHPMKLDILLQKLLELINYPSIMQNFQKHITSV